MLEATLEEHGECQFVCVGGDVGMLRVAKGTGCVVHRANHVAREGQGGVVAGSLVGEGRHVVVPLGTIDPLSREEIRALRGS